MLELEVLSKLVEEVKKWEKFITSSI
jgi:hypothetical protein